MQEDTSAATAYERFKLQWMLEHGFTLRDLVEELEKWMFWSIMHCL